MGLNKKRVVTLRNFDSKQNLWVCSYYTQGRNGYGIKAIGYIDAPENMSEGQKVKAISHFQESGTKLFSFVCCVNERRTKHHVW